MKESSNTKQKKITLTRFPNQNNTIFSLCDCRSEVLVIDYDKEVSCADLCIYKSVNIYLSFWQKMRMIFRILTKGTPYSDQIILSKKQLLEVKEFIELII